ncbi:MAG: flippase-like domain-containing protein [Chloroflexi bacterium]|nr:flippase-like domain-containing protein [Chloroflexota bacterium]
MLNRRFWFGLAVSLLFLGLLLWRLDLRAIGRSLQEAHYVYVIPSIAIYFVAVWFRTLRWHVLLLPLGPISLARLFPVVVVGYAANNLLPMRLGEVVRSYYVGQREGMSKSAALATIALERVFDGLTLLFFLAAVSVFLPVTGLIEGLARDTGVPVPLLIAGTAGPFVLVLALFLVIAHRPWWVLRRLAAFTRKLPGGTGARVNELGELFVTGLGVLRHMRRLIALAILCIPVWLGEAAMYYVIALAFDLPSMLGGVETMAAIILAVTATSNLATALPSSSGGIGPFEFFAAATLVVLGAPAETAAAYAVALHVTLLVPVTLLGLFYLWVGKESLAQLVRMGRRDVATAGRSEDTP